MRTKGSIDIVTRNTACLLTMLSVHALGSAMVNSVYVQTYLQLIGWDASKLGIFSAIGQIGGTIGYFTFMNYSTYKKKARVIYMLSQLPLFLSPMVIALAGGTSFENSVFFTGIMMFTYALQQIAWSMYGTCDQAWRRRYLPVNAIGRVDSIYNILYSAIFVTLAAGATVWLSNVPFPANYRIMFAVGSIFFVISSVLILTIKPVFGDKQQFGNPEPFLKTLKEMYTDPAMRALIFPSIMRGFSVAFLFISVIAGKQFGAENINPGLISIVSQAAMMIGSAIMLVLYKRMDVGVLMNWGAIVALVGLSGMALFTNEILFYVSLFVAYIGQLQIDLGIPIGVQLAYPENRIAPAIGLRMCLYSVVTVFTSSAMGYMFDHTAPIVPILLFTIPYVIGIRWYQKAFCKARQLSGTGASI